MTITDATGQALIAAWRAKYPGAGWPTLSDAKEMLCAALANGKALLSNELLPCPVCGSAFLISQEPHDNHLVAGKFYIFHEYGPIGSAARACPIDVPKHFDTREEAIAAWNRRTPDPELLAARRTIEEMTGALRDLVLLVDLVEASDRTHADAFFILTQQPTTWERARAALSNSGEQVK